MVRSVRSVACLLSAGCLVLTCSVVALGASPHGGSQGQGGPPAGKGYDRTPPGQSAKVAHAGSASGIVQSVATNAVVVRELDGSTVGVPVGASTRIFVDGARGSLAAVEPGFVASASWRAGRPAAQLLAFAPSASLAVVRSLSPRAVVVTNPAGRTVTVRVTPRTHVLVDGEPASLRSVAAGYTLVLPGTRPTARPAAELRFLRPS